LVNLVHNAVDAMPQGGRIKLSTSTKQANAAGDALCEVRVTDTGTGMPQEIIHRIFDPYFTTKGERGTGLGLSVSLSIVRRHGGDVDVTSENAGDNHGTTFTLTKYDPPATSAADGAAKTATTGKHGKARVLVVDDEQNIREILAEILMN